jgi:CBS domain-containing protein
MTVARDLMQPDPLTIPAKASLLEIQQLLVMVGISGAPVVGPAGDVIGVVSSTDVMRAVSEALDEDRDEGEPDDLAERIDAVTAADIATPETLWVSGDASPTDVAQLMRREGIHRVLVGTGRRLEGILTAYDLLRLV